MRFRLLPLLPLFAVPAAAAQVTITPIRDLAFGPVIVGVPTTIAPDHPTRSGQFQFTVPTLSRVQIRFTTLPTRLDGPAGAQLPITFSNNDAMTVGTGPGSVPSAFNPKATRTFQVTSASTNVFIGGRVTPAVNQPQGNYASTITLTVTIF